MAQELAGEHSARRARGLALGLARAVEQRVADVPHARQRAERVDVDASAGGLGEGADGLEAEGERRRPLAPAYAAQSGRGGRRDERKWGRGEVGAGA